MSLADFFGIHFENVSNIQVDRLNLVAQERGGDSRCNIPKLGQKCL